MFFILLAAMLIGVSGPPVLMGDRASDAVEVVAGKGVPGRRVGGGTRCWEVSHA